MKIGSFEFNLRELAGSMGDLGTLLPLAIGYISICKMNPSGLLVMMGVAMMFLVGIELMKFGRDLRLNHDLLPVAATVAGSIAFNMAAGFAAGLLVHYGFVQRIRKAASAD